ncbi:MAG: hypothetical protein PHS30_09140 [Bacteroidales bacterium]|nr:hypothetical protein [Bacteroidales bacterium]
MRHYRPIPKEDFLSMVSLLMDDEEFPYEMPDAILKDLKKVRFDWENTTTFNATTGFSKYPVGYMEVAEGFHVFFVNAGGDWEFPVCFIFYWNKILRAYIPREGNVWDKESKCAYDCESDDNSYEGEIDKDKMVAEILEHIVKKEKHETI